MNHGLYETHGKIFFFISELVVDIEKVEDSERRLIKGEGGRG